MVWLFLLGAAAFVLGGVLSVRPTGAQKQVAQIREKAIREGMHVKLPVSLKFAEDADRGRWPYYCKHVRDKRLHKKFYSVQRGDGRILSSVGNIETRLKTVVDDMLIGAHKDIGGFYLGNGLIGLSWFESNKPEVYSELCETLERIQIILEDAES